MKGIEIKNRGIIWGCLILLTIGSVFIGIVRYSQSVTTSIADEVIRFHVVANSDTTDDQLLKQKVRDEVISYIEPMISHCNNIEETKDILKENLLEIKSVSEKVVKEWGQNYKVYVALDKANFPTKSYGDVIFPAGEYEACRIIIGEGKGENWWCVMYPPLCYLDVATGVVPLEGKEQLKEELNMEQYEIVTNRGNKNYQIKFKLVETINSLLYKDNYKTKQAMQ